MPTSLKLMLFFWQVGLVDTFSLIQFCMNTGSQYGAIVGWSCFRVGIIGLTIFGLLYLFQGAERKRWQNQNDEVLIDEIVSLSE